jgi:hypothetical protein
VGCRGSGVLRHGKEGHVVESHEVLSGAGCVGKPSVRWFMCPPHVALYSLLNWLKVPLYGACLRLIFVIEVGFTVYRHCVLTVF